MKKNLYSFIKVLLVVAMFGFSLTTFAWQNPTQSAPSANVPGPINVGEEGQVKGLGVPIPIGGVTPLFDIRGWLVSDDVSVVDELKVAGVTTLGVTGGFGYVASNDSVQKGNTGIIAKINKFFGLDNVSLFKTQKAYAVVGNGDPNISVGDVGPAGLCECPIQGQSCHPITGVCMFPPVQCTTFADCVNYPGTNACENNHCVYSGPGNPIMPGCGTAAGETTTNIPTLNLCSSGSGSSAVISNPSNASSGIDYWSWSCTGSGANSGLIKSCSSNKKINPILKVNGFSELNGSSVIKGNLNVKNDLTVTNDLVVNKDITINGGVMGAWTAGFCLGDGQHCSFIDPNSRQWGGTYTKPTQSGCTNVNPITGGCSCPSGFASYLMMSFPTYGNTSTPDNLYGCYKKFPQQI